MNINCTIFNQQSVYKRFEKTWSYAGKVLLLARHIFNTVLNSCRWIALSCEARKGFQNAALRLKIFSIVSVPLNMTAMPAMYRKVMKNVHWDYPKGVALSSLSAVLLAADTFDSLTTFVNATLQITSRPTIGWMSSLGMPLAYSIVGIGTIVRIVKIRDVSGLLGEMELCKKLSREELKEALTNLLQRKVVLEEMRAAMLEQRGNAKVVRLIEALEGLLATDEADIAQILREIVEVLKRERGIQTGYLVSNLISAGALSTFSLPGVPFVPFILLAISMTMRIGLQVYQDLGDLPR